MPRTLPWIKTASKDARPKKPAKSPAFMTKRNRHEESDSDNDDEKTRRRAWKDKGKQIASSSPPPSPPSEELMEDGLDKDDRYRMVEDEFLAVAQKFTVHLHAAEYKRQQKLVHKRNAQTINSISRPSVGKMPEETRRRLEGLERAEKQTRLLDVLDKKKSSHSDDSDDGQDLPYSGTMLHGLMDSPRKRNAELSKYVSMKKKTRASAGFKNPTTFSQEPSYESPQPKRTKWSIDDITSSSYDEEDLDAPIPVHEVLKRTGSPALNGKPFSDISSSGSRHVQDPVDKSHRNKYVDPPVAATNIDSSVSSHHLPLLNDSPPKLGNGRPRTSRFERARQLQAEAEAQNQKKKKSSASDIIPTFATS